MEYKTIFVQLLHDQIGEHFEKAKIKRMLEKPKYEAIGDLAFPCFDLAKIYRKSPHQIAEELMKNISWPPIFQQVEAVNGYINIFLNRNEVSAKVIHEILEKKAAFGQSSFGKNNIITIDFSSPNIAKPFSMGHLRSTVIGNSLALIAEKCGYQVIRINHLGDWGTQFGKLIVAYKMWGKEQVVKKNPIKELLKLYIRFHEEAEHDESLNEAGRAWFKKLENNHPEALELWKWFREESWKEFSKIYELLGVSFDSTDGEAFYNDKMDIVIKELKDKGLLEESEGAEIVELGASYPPCLIKKKDGTTLYATRDLAAAIYRKNKYNSVKSLYVVGHEQSLHFKQIFLVLKKMGHEWHEGLEHVPFGMMLKNGKKMSTRKGKIVLLEEVLNDAIELALENMEQKNPTLSSKEIVAQQVGTGAVIFHDLKNYRLNDVEFSLEEMLKFEGDTGPYVQYTHARASALLRKGNYKEIEWTEAQFDEEAWPIVKELIEFPEVIKRAYDGNDPSLIAKYVIQLSKKFNQYYGKVRILAESENKQVRLSLVSAVQIVLREGLRLLGVDAPEEM